MWLEILRKRKWLVLAAPVVVITAAALWAFTRTPIYQASTAVLINRATPEVLGSKVKEVVELGREAYWSDDEYLYNQAAVACSSSVATTVAKRLNLHNNKQFWAAPGEEKPRRKPTLRRAASRLMGSTSCRARRKTTILDIAVEHHDPRLAAQLSNALAEAYIEQNLEFKLASTFGATKWLAEQLDEHRRQLEAQEASLYEFKRKHNLLTMPLSGRQNLVTRRMERFNEELAAVRLKRIALGAQLQQLQALKPDGDPLEIPGTPVLDTPVVHTLKATYVEERRKYLALKGRYLEKHPQVVEQEIRMKAAAEDLRREVRNRYGGVAAAHREALQHERQLAAAIQQVKKEALELGQREEAFRRLKRPLDQTNQLYGVLLARLKESSVSGQLKVNNIRLLEGAVAPRVPVRPRIKVILALALLLGLLLGVGAALLAESLDRTIRSEEDLSEHCGVVCLGAVPRVVNEVKESSKVHPMLARSPGLIVHHRPMSIPAEAWRIVRTNLLFSSPDRELKTIVVTSPEAREGKTTLMVGLATAVAQAGKRVLIIDADLRKPQMHSVFGLPKGIGLTTALRGEAEVEELVCSTEVPDLFVLPAGPIPPNPAELCQSERLLQLVTQLADRFDRVFIDSPPASVVTDPVLLAARFDAVVLVARTGKLPKKALVATARQIEEVGGHVIGCVLNDVDIGQRGYSYYPYRMRAYRYGREAYARAEGSDEPAA